MGKVLSEYIEKHKAVFANISEDAYDIISIMSKAQQPSELKQRYVTEGGKIDMCKAIDDMIRDGEKRGEKRIACLINRLAEQNRMQDVVWIITE